MEPKQHFAPTSAVFAPLRADRAATTSGSDTRSGSAITGSTAGRRAMVCEVAVSTAIAAQWREPPGRGCGLVSLLTFVRAPVGAGDGRQPRGGDGGERALLYLGGRLVQRAAPAMCRHEPGAAAVRHP
jgi:hypothetical protein